MLKLPKAIIFDTDNTLYNYFPSHNYAIKKVALELKALKKISNKTFDKTYTKSRKIIKKRLNDTASSHSRILYFQTMIEILFDKTDAKLSLHLEEVYWHEFFKKSKLFDGVIEFLKLLKYKNIKIANLTDLTSQIQFKKLVHFKIDKYFDFIVTSEEAGKDKPNILPFKLIIKKMKIPPKKIWMIGDNPKSDIEGASRVGFTKIQILHSGVKLINSKKTSPDLIFKKYSELIKIIKKI
tara:strand:- start:1439 stop:2152 length:714 start_codon:yes stop_codon:yes gene_type:complete